MKIFKKVAAAVAAATLALSMMAVSAMADGLCDRR